jgi:hypothetical protein
MMRADGSSGLTERQQRKALVQDVEESDVSKLRALLHVARHRFASDWTVVFDGDADLVFFGTDEPTTVSGMLDPPMATVRLVSANPPLPVGHTPSRTCELAYEPLVELLLGLEDRSAQLSAMSTSTQRTMSVQSLTAPIPMPVTAVSAAANSTTTATTISATANNSAFRLRRWPEAAVLRAGRYSVRLASFLSTRHLSLEELSRLSNVDLMECRTFVDMLMKLDLIDCTPLQPKQASQPPTNSSAAAKTALTNLGTTADAKAGVAAGASGGSAVDFSLLSRIRRRLGLFVK